MTPPTYTRVQDHLPDVGVVVIARTYRGSRHPGFPFPAKIDAAGKWRCARGGAICYPTHWCYEPGMPDALTPKEPNRE